MSVANDIITAIGLAMEGITGKNNYDVDVKTVTTWDVDLMDAPKSRFPQISILDTGEEQRLLPPDSNGDSLYESEVIIRGAVRAADETQLQAELLKMEAVIKKRIHVGVTDTNLIDLRIDTVVDRVYSIDSDSGIGVTAVRCVMSYFISGSTY